MGHICCAGSGPVTVLSRCSPGVGRRSKTADTVLAAEVRRGGEAGRATKTRKGGRDVVRPEDAIEEHELAGGGSVPAGAQC